MKTKKFTRFVAGSIAMMLMGGCAAGSRNIATNYVSPLLYRDYSCNQTIAEMSRISTKVNQLAGNLDSASARDKMITGVGVVLFWPALFALGGSKQQEAEYAQLKGEYDALNQVAIQKNCTVIEATRSPDTPVFAQPAGGSEYSPRHSPTRGSRGPSRR